MILELLKYLIALNRCGCMQFFMVLKFFRWGYLLLVYVPVKFPHCPLMRQSTPSFLIGLIVFLYLPSLTFYSFLTFCKTMLFCKRNHNYVFQPVPCSFIFPVTALPLAPALDTLMLLPWDDAICASTSVHGTLYPLFTSILYSLWNPYFFHKNCLHRCVLSGVVRLPFSFNGHMFSCIGIYRCVFALTKHFIYFMNVIMHWLFYLVMRPRISTISLFSLLHVIVLPLTLCPLFISASCSLTLVLLETAVFFQKNCLHHYVLSGAVGLPFWF